MKRIIVSHEKESFSNSVTFCFVDFIFERRSVSFLTCPVFAANPNRPFGLRYELFSKVHRNFRLIIFFRVTIQMSIPSIPANMPPISILL